MKVIEIGAEFDGALLELSQGGCTFRQASMFALDRLNELVLIHTEFFEIGCEFEKTPPWNVLLLFG